LGFNQLISAARQFSTGTNSVGVQSEGEAQWTFDFGKVFVGIILIAIIGFSVEFIVFKKLEKITLEKWGTLA